jgi:hypothetical protein
MPLVDFPPHTFPVGFVFFACLDEQFGAMTGAAEMSLQILPAAVRFEGAVCVGTAVWAEGL